MSKKVYEIVNQKIKDRLEEALKNNKKFYWVKPWNGGPTPMNFISQKSYRGINLLLLDTGEYITFKQIKELQKKDSSIKIKKGSKQETIYYFNFMEKEDDETGKVKNIPFLRFYKVYNINDVEGLKSNHNYEEITHTKTEDMEKADKIIEDFCKRDNLKIEVVKGGNKACYIPSLHAIRIPDKGQFKSIYEYYSTVLHELGHATSKTLKRELGSSFGSEKYAFEELVAEISSQILLAEMRIIDDNASTNSIAYLQGWLERLGKENIYYIVKASNQATKACDFILNNAIADEKAS